METQLSSILAVLRTNIQNGDLRLLRGFRCLSAGSGVDEHHAGVRERKGTREIGTRKAWAQRIPYPLSVCDRGGRNNLAGIGGIIGIILGR
jgi:hypothetical protein